MQMLKKCSSDKINVTKNALFFLSKAPTHHSFTFNLQFAGESQDLSLENCLGFLFLIPFRFY